MVGILASNRLYCLMIENICRRTKCVVSRWLEDLFVHALAMMCKSVSVKVTKYT